MPTVVGTAGPFVVGAGLASAVSFMANETHPFGILMPDPERESSAAEQQTTSSYTLVETVGSAGATVGVAVVALAAGALLLFAVSYAAFAVVPQFFTDSVTRHNACTALSDTHQFYAALYHYIVRDGAFPSAHFEGNIQAKLFVNFS